MKTKEKILIPLSLSLVILGGTLGVITKGFTNWNIFNKGDNEKDLPVLNDDELPNSISKGITLKNLSKGKNELGQVTQTISYSISPSNASMEDVKVTIKYYDGSDCSNVMSVNHNQNKKEITLTSLNEFNKPIQLRVESVMDKSIYAIATIDYTKKIKSVNVNSNVFVSKEYRIESKTLFAPVYSTYTKDADLTYTLSGGNIEIIDTNEKITEIYNLGEEGVDFLYQYASLIKDVVLNYANPQFDNSIKSKLPDGRVVYELTENKDIHDILIYLYTRNNGDMIPDIGDSTEYNYLQFKVKNIDVNVSDGTTSKCEDLIIKTTIADLDFSYYYVELEKINLELSQIVF